MDEVDFKGLNVNISVQADGTFIKAGEGPHDYARMTRGQIEHLLAKLNIPQDATVDFDPETDLMNILIHYRIPSGTPDALAKVQWL